MAEHAATPATTSGRHFSGILTNQIVRYVRHTLGDVGVDDLIALAGELPSIETLQDPRSWVTWDEMHRMLDAAGELLGGWEGVRRAGGYLNSEEESMAFQALGTPSEILRSVAEASSKYATMIDFEALDITDDYGLVASKSREGFPRYDLLCAMTVGVLSHSTKIFGLPPSRVVEEECETRGADRCVFRVSWADGSSDAERQVLKLQGELTQVSRGFRNLQRTVRELVSGADVDEVLARITSRATRAVWAPRYLLAVNPSGETTDVRVQQIGFKADEIDVEVAKLLAEELAEDPARLVADVRSGDRLYGRMAAYNAEGIAFIAEEQTLFVAYAELAAAALDSATALEASRHQEQIARALIDLGAALARLTTAEEAAQRLADAVPKMIGCDTASVFLVDPTTRALRAVATNGMLPTAAKQFMSFELSGADTPMVGRLLDDPAPVFIDLNVSDPVIRAMMKVTNARSAVAVPITNGIQTFGVVTASSFTDSIRPDPILQRHLAGIADQGANALQNAELLGAVRYQALHDALTKLPNQRLLEDRVDLALKQARRNNCQASVLFLDLDRFKNVNDTLGHAIGDLLLKQVSLRVQDSVRDVDTVSRLGGDEFAVLLPGLNSVEEATLVAERISQALQAPFKLDDHEVYVTSSIGISVFPEDGGTYKELLKSADAAMYAAKSAGRNTCRTYSQSMPQKSTESLTLESDLHGAIERGELRAVYQPLLDLTTMRVVHAEALVRWQHPRLGTLSPDAFLPLAEESGMIVEIDAWMLRSVCHQLAYWETIGIDDLGVSLNVSEQDLCDRGYVDRVAAALNGTGLVPHRLELELTKKAAEAAGPVLDEVLKGLSDLGVRLAIDDLGSGNVALTRLTRDVIDTLKIDRSLLAEITEEARTSPMVSAMISMGQTLGVRVVAEGIETEVQAEFVRQHGCNVAQGFYFSRPLDRGPFEAFVTDATNRSTTLNADVPPTSPRSLQA